MLCHWLAVWLWTSQLSSSQKLFSHLMITSPQKYNDIPWTVFKTRVVFEENKKWHWDRCSDNLSKDIILGYATYSNHNGKQNLQLSLEIDRGGRSFSPFQEGRVNRRGERGFFVFIFVFVVLFKHGLQNDQLTSLLWGAWLTPGLIVLLQLL